MGGTRDDREGGIICEVDLLQERRGQAEVEVQRVRENLQEIAHRKAVL